MDFVVAVFAGLAVALILWWLKKCYAQDLRKILRAIRKDENRIIPIKNNEFKVSWPYKVYCIRLGRGNRRVERKRGRSGSISTAPNTWQQRGKIINLIQDYAPYMHGDILSVQLVVTMPDGDEQEVELEIQE